MSPPSRGPLHVVPDQPGHGVARYAAEVAGATGSPVVDLATAMTLPPTRVHVHVTDRLFGSTCEEAARTLVHLAARHPTTVTLHDVPQPGEGAGFPRRAAAYRAVVAATAGSVVSSHHEAALARRHLGADCEVVHLPVHPGLRAARERTAGALPTVVGVLGWVYPGKGHAEVVDACARARDEGRVHEVVVRALGAPAPGHDDLVADLAARGADRGVEVQATGWVDDADLPRAIGDVDVPVAAHHHVSASGSINSWIGAGRRPLVVDGPYPRELVGLRPGTLTPVAADGLAAAVGRAAHDPASTWLTVSTGTRPHLDDVARAYLRWWR